MAQNSAETFVNRCNVKTLWVSMKASTQTPVPTLTSPLHESRYALRRQKKSSSQVRVCSGRLAVVVHCTIRTSLSAVAVFLETEVQLHNTAIEYVAKSSKSL